MSSQLRSVALAMTVIGTLAGSVAQAADVSGTVTNRKGKKVGTFTGTFAPQRFEMSAGKIVGVGTLTGTLTGKGGDVMATVNTVVSSPVTAMAFEHIAAAQALSPQLCDILFLQLGPIDLNLLGLIVHVDQITIDIDADSEGGLVGDLLCSLAGPGGLLDLNGLLNQILASISLADLLGFLNGLLG